MSHETASWQSLRVPACIACCSASIPSRSRANRVSRLNSRSSFPPSVARSHDARRSVSASPGAAPTASSQECARIRPPWRPRGSALPSSSSSTITERVDSFQVIKPVASPRTDSTPVADSSLKIPRDADSSARPDSARFGGRVRPFCCSAPASTSAWWSPSPTSICIRSRRSACAASISGVRPCPSAAAMDAPSWSSSPTLGASPHSTARWRGVRPRASTSLTSERKPEVWPLTLRSSSTSSTHAARWTTAISYAFSLRRALTATRLMSSLASSMWPR
mmetsp:Transcript_40110/g.110423  ORF Transcript_40110/g.110423 Transcript_40110/m.110423 type:complete len:278 (+) Transcript_40110:181-1014(+)